MSSNPVDLSSDHFDSPNYTSDTPANQEFVAGSQAATPVEVALQEITFASFSVYIESFWNFSNTRHLLCQGITSVCEAIQATKEGLTKKKKKKKKKKTLVKGVTLPTNNEATVKDKPATSESKDKQGEDPTILRNSLPVEIEHADLHHLREYFSIPS
ncbi:hypothetical protein LIER_35809 [Lithospermum erythrorhizon]|uniref:Uncharacterized protein n=1 Tax=Lithospermum erythrorhizon TaxID=34254 RepID=A0AAV3NY87_LITER